MNYRYLIASDMDFTLIMPGKDVSEQNRQAVLALRENGCAFTLATGRTFYLIRKYCKDLKIDIPCITSNGGALYDPVTGNIISEDIPEETVKQIVPFLIEEGVDIVGYSNEGVFFAPNSKRRDFFINYNKGVPDDEKAKMYDLPVNGPYPRFSKILTVGADEKMRDYLRSRPDLECAASTGELFDIMKKGISKGEALLRLADILNIPHENTIAIGDNENDLPMLKSAAFSIAMGGSPDSVLSCCNKVTTTCEEDGFAKAVYDHILPLIK